MMFRSGVGKPFRRLKMIDHESRNELRVANQISGAHHQNDNFWRLNSFSRVLRSMLLPLPRLWDEE